MLQALQQTIQQHQQTLQQQLQQFMLFQPGAQAQFFLQNQVSNVFFYILIICINLDPRTSYFGDPATSVSWWSSTFIHQKQLDTW